MFRGRVNYEKDNFIIDGNGYCYRLSAHNNICGI